MPDDVPFSEAERVFNKVEDLVEAAVASYSTGAYDITLCFDHLNQGPENRLLLVRYRDAHDSPRKAYFRLPSLEGRLHAWPEALTAMLELTRQEESIFLDLVRLGGCVGFWQVNGLITAKGQHVYRSSDVQSTIVSPMALLTAFAGGELEEQWPNRVALIENGFFVFQAAQADKRSIDLEQGLWDNEWDYL
jgi:hypothetical protein